LRIMEEEMDDGIVSFFEECSRRLTEGSFPYNTGSLLPKEKGPLVSILSSWREFIMNVDVTVMAFNQMRTTECSRIFLHKSSTYSTYIPYNKVEDTALTQLRHESSLDVRHTLHND